ncbi:MAG: hypothetical protein D6743_02970 [Calditrichaeota bacterium]|nr:MAG: hypothetical protein D6743_02970 [Calditrichota bacterium]
MKLIVLMSLTDYRDKVRKMFEKHEVKIYSEVEITGHTSETIQRYGWWVFEKEDVPMQSTLFFAVISKEKADEILADISALRAECDPDHPPRAFQVNVEKMV